MSGWPLKPLLDAADLVTTRVGSFKGVRQYVSTGDVDGTAIVRSESVTFEGRPSRADVVAAVGDVLFARMQATDKVVVVSNETKENLWSTGFAALRPQFHTHPRWLNSWLRSKQFIERKDALCTGATQKAITNEGIRKLTIPLPPFPEQERMVRILDEAEALRRLRTEANKRIGSLEAALFHQMFDDRQDAWLVEKFGNVGSLDRGRSQHRPRDESWLFGGPYPFIQTGDVANSLGYITSFTQTYSERGLAQSRLWPAGTLCITIAANIARTGVLAFDACFPDSVVGFIPGDCVTVEYIQAWLRTIQKALEDDAPQAAQKNINLKTLRELDLVVPPLELQRTFAVRVAEIHLLEATQTTSRQRLDDMYQSLLHRAFQG
ncbi:MAG: restriction endonuclease subunit S, partial [Candidatus Latescibacter sp.]|nr:restriction endonuclease subunit S [Candidatus Latescibacter sp.]